MPLYAPEGCVVLAATPYQTVVVSLLAVVEVVLMVFGEPLAGIPANFMVPLIAALLWADVGPAPNPPTPSTRYPHVFTACATGVVCVPVDAGIVLEPEVSVVEAPESAICKVKPSVSFVLTVMVSLAIVCAPDPVGVTLAVTVPLLVKTLITELIAELMVVEAVAAPATAGNASALTRSVATKITS